MCLVIVLILYSVQVVDIDHPDSEQFPLFASAERYEADLEPGDVLFIPALWFHNMLGMISEVRAEKDQFNFISQLWTSEWR